MEHYGHPPPMFDIIFVVLRSVVAAKFTANGFDRCPIIIEVRSRVETAAKILPVAVGNSSNAFLEEATIPFDHTTSAKAIPPLDSASH